MKKLISLLAVFAICVGLSACDPGSYSFRQDEMENGLVCVELIDYDNSEQKQFVSRIPDHFDDLLPFDFGKMTVLSALDSGKYEEFTARLCQAEIL